MKVINTYIVSNDKYSQKDILFECLNDKWFYQTQVLQNEWETIVLEISESKAKELINN